MQQCQKCEERATLHITEIDGDNVQEVHLCYKCAEKYLSESEEPSAACGPSDPQSLAAAAAAQVTSTAQCPLCKTTFNDFRSSGRLGCPHDYEVFKRELRPLLENIHGKVRHIGKVPKRLPADTQAQTRLIQLRQELQQAVAIEDYEAAARLRDEIEALERKRFVTEFFQRSWLLPSLVPTSDQTHGLARSAMFQGSWS